MAEPRVHFATTVDGVSIAYTAVGRGPALVYLQPFSHQLLDWSDPLMSVWYAALAEQFTVIRFDIRCFGVSQRENFEFSFADIANDLEAVVEQAGLTEFDLMGISGLGFIAADYAVANPERVRRLVLWATPADGRVFGDGPRSRTIRATIGIDAELALESEARIVFGNQALVTPERMAHVREMMSAADLGTYLTGVREFESRGSPEQIQCPTLAIYPRDSSWISSREAQGLAAHIPNCEFVQTNAGSYPYQTGDPEEAVALIADFLIPEDISGDAGETPSAFRTILFTDVVASTPLLAQLKDEKMRAVMRDHDKVLEAAVTDNGGRVIKTIGDAFMAEFAVPSGAVDAAIAAQRGIRDKFAGSDVPIRLRIGINAGEPIVEDGDLHGASVVVAKRLESAADVGGILISDVVKAAVLGKEFVLKDRGEFDLKGFDEPVRAWSVEW